MIFFRKLLIVMFLVACVFGISACGKVSSPSPLEGSGYPHSYPRH